MAERAQEDVLEGLGARPQAAHLHAAAGRSAEYLLGADAVRHEEAVAVLDLAPLAAARGQLLQERRGLALHPDVEDRSPRPRQLGHGPAGRDLALVQDDHLAADR